MTINQPISNIAMEEADSTAIKAVSINFLLVMLPHTLHVPLWVTGCVMFSLLWRGAQAANRIRQIPRWLLIPLVLIGGLSVFAQYWTIVGRDAGLALLTVMTAFKFLETKTHRDILILIFLCFFLLATHFLFTQSILIALYMFAALIVTTTTLLTINQRDNTISLKSRLQAASKMIALSIPIMLILFILVPRIPGPLWGLSNEQRGGVTGLSDSMSPGQISDLIKSNEVAFRVSFDGDIPPQEQLYWRGPVMVDFNGSSWSMQKHKKINSFKLREASPPISYTIILEPHGKHWLFGLELPTQLIQDSFMSSEYQLISSKPVNDMKRYSMQSRLGFYVGEDESIDYMFKASEFPQYNNPRTIALGQSWSRQFATDIEIINHALTMFRQQEFVYTLQPPLLGDNPSDEFLFETRRGFCEHYASSFALLMRAAGIPARIVTGYQGGEINEVGGYLIVRQSDAHAWTEVWLDGRGWVRIDPTAAVSPDRIENGLGEALDELASFRIGERNPLLGRLLYNWDNLQYSWNNWVLNYDHRKQAQFLNKLGLGIKDWGDMIIALVICVSAITAIYWLVSWYRERPAPPPVYEKIIQQLLRKLARSGYQRRSSEDVFEFLDRIQRQQDYRDPQLRQIFSAYSKIKYARGYQNDKVIRGFQKMVADWKVVTRGKQQSGQTI